MDTSLKAKFDYLNEVHKQMLTLATGVLALTATFFGSQQHIMCLIYFSWASLIVSIISGITAMGMLVDHVDKGMLPKKGLMIIRSWAFLVGLLLFVTSVISSRA